MRGPIDERRRSGSLLEVGSRTPILQLSVLDQRLVAIDCCRERIEPTLLAKQDSEGQRPMVTCAELQLPTFGLGVDLLKRRAKEKFDGKNRNLARPATKREWNFVARFGVCNVDSEEKKKGRCPLPRLGTLSR